MELLALGAEVAGFLAQGAEVAGAVEAGNLTGMQALEFAGSGAAIVGRDAAKRRALGAAGAQMRSQSAPRARPPAKVDDSERRKPRRPPLPTGRRPTVSKNSQDPDRFYPKKLHKKNIEALGFNIDWKKHGL